MYKIYITLIVSCFTLSILAQDFDAEDQYEQLMNNAKVAFEAKQYSEAVMFYRQALELNPQAKLPRFKIEDIRTIYIEKEMDTLSNISPDVAQKEKGFKLFQKKKEVEEEQSIREKAEKAATKKMNQDADQALNELKKLKVAAVPVADDVELESDSLQIDEVEQDRESGMVHMQAKDKKQLDSIQPKEKPQLTARKKDLPPVEIMDEEPNEEPKVQKSVSAPEKKVETKVPKPKDLNSLSPEEKQAWIEKEKERLLKKYPNKKTVEEIEKPGKKITRVVMNIDGKVSVYLKVRHSWGATFYFIDEVGQELRSINQQYFNLKTSLSTYGD